MKNYLLYSDLHIKPETLEVCDQVLTTVGELAVKHDATIINGGDTFNVRGILPTSCVDLLTRHFKNWLAKGLTQHILIGNHDQEDRDGEIHPMRVFDGWGEGKWKVIDKPTVIDKIAYLPYIPHEKIKAALDEIPKTVKVAVVHWGIKGAKRNDWNTDMDGVPVEWLAHFKRVFSGHYHYRNEFENVQYIGSPYQQNHSESNQPKGVLLYEHDKNKTSFIEIEDTPKYHQVRFKIQDTGEVVCEEGKPEEVREKDHVRITLEGDAEAVSRFTHEEASKYLRATSVKFDRQGRVKSHSRLGITSGETLDPLTLMQKYVDFVDTELDRSKLLKIGGELVHS